MVALLMMSLAPAAPPGDGLKLKMAEMFFHQGVEQAADSRQARPDFALAAQVYEKFRQEGADNPELFLNEGNAWFLAGDLPQSILAYRRGLRHAPHDLDLQANLAHARAQVNFPQAGAFARPPIDHRPPWLPRWPSLLLLLAVVCYSLGWLALARWYMVRRAPWLKAGLMLLAFTLLPAAGFAWEEWQLHQDLARPLVVIARDDTYLRRGNGAAYPPRYDTPLHQGTEARLLFDRRDGWLQIELAGGEVGWVQRAACHVDERHPPPVPGG